MPVWATSGRTYWTLVVKDKSPFPTVFGSFHGAVVDPARPIFGERRRAAAVVFTSEERARGYRSALSPDDVAKFCFIAEVVWVRNGVVRYPDQVSSKNELLRVPK